MANSHISSTAGANVPLLRNSICSPFWDFWLLGGLSILVCALMHFANFFKDNSQMVQSHFLQIGAIFSGLALIGNDPHFLISYRFGYGRGLKYIFKSWFSLIILPLGLIAGFTVAYFFFNSEVPRTDLVNHVLKSLGFGFKLGADSSVGDEILGLSIWLMYMTAIWHYCKQVYGCMMVYAFYHSYHLKKWQKLVFKWSAISIGLYNLTYLVNMLAENSGTSSTLGVRLSIIHLPEWLLGALLVVLILMAVACVAIVIQVHAKTKTWPPVNFLVPWLALFIWWVPIGHLPEYYFIMVPFFHSLQYLPFAFRVENESIKRGKMFNATASFRILLLIAIGFLYFEFVPTFLDNALDTEANKTAWFFATAFVVFINIHHFFIDSVVWKFSDSEIKNKLLYSSKA